MAPDTQDAVIKINARMIGAITTLIALFITGIAWFTRLEYRTESNGDEIVKIYAQMEVIRNDRARDNDRITRAESQLTFILQGIEEIKSLIKERRPGAE
jgi:hypothetical protein